MKNQKGKQNYNSDIPPAIFNWLLLCWVIMFFLLDWISRKFFVSISYIFIIPVVCSAVWFILLAVKGTNIKFFFNPRTDNDGWVMRTGKTLKYAVKRLAQNYPKIIKHVKLKDSTFKVTVTKKYKHNPNPISIEEIE